MEMGKKPLMTALACAAILASCAPCNPASASGLPTVDGANLAQNLTTSIQAYQQRLQAYSTQLQQLQQQISAYERQIKDATRPWKQVYDQAYKAYSQTMDVVNGINNIRNKYVNAMQFIKENYGDSDFWKQCARSGCDPTAQLNLAREATSGALNFASESGQESVRQTQGSLEQTHEIEKEISEKGDQGTATALQSIARMQARTNEILAESNKLSNQMIQANNAVVENDRAREAASAAKLQKELDAFEKSKSSEFQDSYKSKKMYTALDFMK